MIKKLVYISATALTFAIQGVAFAQANQGSRITQKEYQIVVSAVCNASGDVTAVENAVESMANRSISPQKVRKLKEIAVGMLSLPPIEKDRICMDQV